MSGRLTRLVDRAARFLEDDAGDVFQIGRESITGNYAPGDESVMLTTTGGQQEKYGGTFFVSRLRYPAFKPVLMLVITGPDKTAYRIAGNHPDASGWTLTLTCPNARHK